MAPPLKSHSTLSQEQPLEHHAALLRDEVFNAILYTVNTQCGTASWASERNSGRTTSEGEEFDSVHLPQILDIPIAGSGHGDSVTFRSSVSRTVTLSSTPHLVPQPVSFNLSGIPNIRYGYRQ